MADLFFPRAEEGACSGRPDLIELFFGPEQSEENPRKEEGRTWRVKTAKSICHGCPVEMSCLLWALSSPLPHGIAGGMTDRERRKLRKSIDGMLVPQDEMEALDY